MVLEFFIPCWFALLNLFPQNPTDAEIAEVLKTIPQQLLICEQRAKAAPKDPYAEIAQLGNDLGTSFSLSLQSRADIKLPPLKVAHCKDSNSCDSTFAACWLTIARPPFIPTKPSLTYLKTALRGLRVSWGNEIKTISVFNGLNICQKVAHEAQVQQVEPQLAIAVAFKESLFSMSVSDKGAIGPMGVIYKHHCGVNKKLCTPKHIDPIQLGVSTLQKYLNLNPFDWCTPLAKYNAGECGRCDQPKDQAVPRLCRADDGSPKRLLFESSFNYAQFVYGIYEELCETFGDCHNC